MGRKLLELKRFNKGMAGNLDGPDLDPEIAGLALNVDPEAPQGVLRGLRSFAGVLTHSGPATHFDRMKLLEKRDGVNALIGVEHATGEVAIIDDYDGTPSYTDLGQATVSGQSCIALVNNQAYIGCGADPSSPPQWIGEVTTNQFSQVPPSGYQREDAVTRAPLMLEFSSTTNICPSGTPATSITVSGEDASQCPAKGFITIPFKTDRGDLTTAQVSYTSRTATTFDGLQWPTNAVLNMPSNYTIGDDAGHDTIRWSEVENTIVLDAIAQDNSNGWDYLAGSSGDLWEPDQMYVMAVSFTYDGYKESPLTILKHGAFYAGGIVPTAYDSNELHIGVSVQGFGATFSRRVTAVNVYIAPFSSAQYTYLGVDTGRTPIGEQQGSFRLAQSLSIETAWSIPRQDGGVTFAYDTYFTIGGYTGETYENKTGQPEYIRSSALHYSMAAELNGELFVTDIYNPNAPDEDWGNYMCKSEALRFENFDWLNNYVVLPRPPTAIAAYAGRIYVFDQFTMYRVNPQRLYVEDVFEGIGALNQQAVQATEYGLFIASYHDVYLFDGKQIRPIIEPVAEMQVVNGYDTYGYRNFVQSMNLRDPENLRLSFDAELRCLVVYAHSGSTTRYWLYRADRGSWFAATGPQSPAFCLSHRNSILASGIADKAVNELFRGSRVPWTWITGKLTMNADSQQKKFREVRAEGSDVIISYRMDNDTASFDSIATLDSYLTSSNGKWIQVKMDGTVGEEVSSLNIVFRDKGGYPT